MAIIFFIIGHFYLKTMSLKRIHPSINYNQFPEEPFEKTLDDDLSEYECFRKRVKKDYSTLQYPDPQEQPHDYQFTQENDLNLQTDNLYAQEFENLKACSFKTISRIGQDKNYSFIKNQVAQSDDKFSLTNKKKIPSLINLSEEKSKRKQTHGRNIVKNHRKPIASFGSLNEISKLQKRSSVDSYRLNGMRNRLKKIESSISGLGSGSMNEINTQMMNDMMDFKINDEDEVDELYLTRMIETALIKNVRISANLCMVFGQRDGEVRFFQNLKMYKLLDVDGFSIKSLYASSDKIRINLKKPITNKQFQRKFVFQPQQHPNIQSTKLQSTIENGVQFEGSYYDLATHKSEEIKFYLSEVKDNVGGNGVNSDEIENINFENWMMPQESSFDCSFGFGAMMVHSKSDN